VPGVKPRAAGRQRLAITRGLQWYKHLLNMYKCDHETCYCWKLAQLSDSFA